MSAVCPQNDQNGVAASVLPHSSQCVDHASEVMSIVHSRDVSTTQVDNMCKHLVHLYASSAGAADECPPRLFTQAKVSGRKWILDIFSSSTTELQLQDNPILQLWAALEAFSAEWCEMRSLQAATRAIVSAGKDAARAAPSSSNECLRSCGEYLLLLTSGNTHALLGPVLTLCSLCVRAMPHASMHVESLLPELLTKACTTLLQTAAQIAVSTGGSSHQQFSAQFQELMYFALPLVHSPDIYMLHMAHDDRSGCAHRIDEALRQLCVQPALLQPSILELQSDSFEQGLAQLVGEHGRQFNADSKLTEANESTQVTDTHLKNTLFTPWDWLEHTASTGVQEPWQQAMLSTLPEHAYWLVGLCSSVPDSVLRQTASSGRLKRTRVGVDAKQTRLLQWGSTLAVLHRSALAVQNILHRGRKPHNKQAKHSKRNSKKPSGAGEALISALQACAMTIRSCGDHKVYNPAEDSTGVQKSTLKQFIQFLLRLCDENHENCELRCGAAAVVAEVVPLDHSIVTSDDKLFIQLACSVGASADASTDADGGLQGTRAPMAGSTLICNLVEAFSTLRSMPQLLSSIFSSTAEHCSAQTEAVLFNEAVHDALASAIQRAPVAQASNIVETASTALTFAASHHPSTRQLQCICSISATALSSILVARATAQVSGIAQACRGLVDSMQAVVEALCMSPGTSTPTDARAFMLSCLPLLRLQAVVWRLHCDCAASDPCIAPEPPASRLPLHAAQALQHSTPQLKAAREADHSMHSSEASHEAAHETARPCWCCQAGVLLQACRKDGGDVPALVVALVALGASAIVDAANLPVSSVSDALAGCASWCMQLLPFYSDVLMHAQFSLACQTQDVGRPGHVKSSIVDCDAATVALRLVSALAGLLFACSSPAAQGLVCDREACAAAAAAHVRAQGVAAVHQLLQPSMLLCVNQVPAPVRQQAVAVCIEGCVSASAACSSRIPLHDCSTTTATSTATSSLEQSMKMACKRSSLHDQASQSVVAQYLDVLNSIGCRTDVIEALEHKGDVLHGQLHASVKRCAKQTLCDGSSLMQAAAACMSTCVAAGGDDTSALWEALHALCTCFLASSTGDEVATGAPSEDRRSPDGEALSALQSLLQLSWLTARLVATGTTAEPASRQLVAHFFVGSLASAGSCAVLLHRSACFAERNLCLEVTACSLSWLAEACSAGQLHCAEVAAPPGALAAWLAACEEMRAGGVSAAVPCRGLPWVDLISQLRSAELLSHIAAQALQAQDSKKQMKKVLQGIHPQLASGKGAKRKRCDAQDSVGEFSGGSAILPAAVLPLVSGVANAVRSRRSAGGEGGSGGVDEGVHAGCRVALRGVKRACSEVEQLLPTLGASSADKGGDAVNGNRGMHAWLGQLHVVRSQAACCEQAGGADGDVLVQQLKDSIDCASTLLSKCSSSQALCEEHERQILQLLSSVEMCLEGTAGVQHVGAPEATFRAQQLCLDCMDMQARTAAGYPVQRPCFQAASIVLQRAFEACDKPHAQRALQHVLGLIDGRPQCSVPSMYAGLSALLLMLECRSPALRRKLRQHAVAVFSTLQTCVHANVATGDTQRDQLHTHAVNCLALRCMESMCAQKVAFRRIKPVLHQAVTGVAACTAALQAHLRGAAQGLSAVPDVGMLQTIGGSCSLLTAIMRHRPEGAGAVAAAVPWLSQQFIECIACTVAALTKMQQARGGEMVGRAAQAVGNMWEAAAACKAGSCHMPLLVMVFLKARSAGVPGEDVLLGSALQLVGSLTDSQLQQTHRKAVKEDDSGRATTLLVELRAQFTKRFKYTGKV